MDEKWLKKETITFYDIEMPYKAGSKRWAGRTARTDLIAICRYFFLQNLFDEKFWKAFTSDCPAEAHGITATWDRDELVGWPK
jgi:antitoxin MazE